MKKAITGAILGFAAASGTPVLGQVKDLVFTNSNGWTTTLYGHVNLTYQSVDDGTETYNDIADNSNSPSRVGMWVDSPVGDNRFRFNFEASLGITGTSSQSQLLNPSFFDWNRTDIRKFEIAYSGGFGTFWLGQGSMAADGIAELDISGTSIAGYSSVADLASGYLFRIGNTLSPIAVGGVFQNFDASRRMRIRYDTPNFSGFKFSVAYGQEVLSSFNNNHYYDAALRYGLDTDSFQFDAGLGYTWVAPEVGSKTEHLVGSATAKHNPSGMNVTFASGRNQNSGSNYYYTKLGWSGRPFSVGDTSIAVDYYNGSDFVSDGSSSDAWGIQAVQHIVDLHLDVYLGYRSYAFSDKFASYQDVDALLIGARWKF